MDSLLDQIRPLAKDRALDHRYRLSVRADIERIKDAWAASAGPPGMIDVFACSGRGLYEEVPLPRRCYVDDVSWPTRRAPVRLAPDTTLRRSAEHESFVI